MEGITKFSKSELIYFIRWPTSVTAQIFPRHKKKLKAKKVYTTRKYSVHNKNTMHCGRAKNKTVEKIHRWKSIAAKIATFYKQTESDVYCFYILYHCL